MKQVQIAVAGAGLIGLRHIEEIGRCQDTALAAIVDPAQKAVAISQQASVPHYLTLSACFSAARPDGVILASPNHIHAEQGLECIAAGIPVLVEKPLAHALADGQRLVEAAERAGVKLLVGHHRRHSPILHTAVKVVQSGILGRLVAVQGSAVFYKPDADGYFEGPNIWRQQKGGGPVLINMIHEIDNLRAMVGEIVAVQAMSSNSIRQFQVEDTVAISLRFANGALGSFLLSDTAACPKSWEQTSQENTAYPSYDDEDAYVIMGTNGSLGVPTMRLRTYAGVENPSWLKPFQSQKIPIERVDPLAAQIAHFAAVIRGQTPPLVTGRDGLQNLRVVDAILSAAKSGGIVTLGEGG